MSAIAFPVMLGLCFYFGHCWAEWGRSRSRFGAAIAGSVVTSIVIAVAFLAIMFLIEADSHGADYGDDWPLVEQSIDTIAVCHVDDGAVLIFFFDRVQGEWTCLDHRWVAGDMAIGYDVGRGTGSDADHRQSHPFTLAWRDDSDSCHRLIRAAAWIESREGTSPLAAECDKPWHARLLEPGLAKARPRW